MSSQILYSEMARPMLLQSLRQCHDRYIIVDEGAKDMKVYHCDASSKDAGKKVCAINAIENTALIHPIIDALLLLPDRKV